MSGIKVNSITLPAMEDPEDFFPQLDAGGSHLLEDGLDPDEDLDVEEVDDLVVEDNALGIKDMNPVVTLFLLRQELGEDWYHLDRDAIVDALLGCDRVDVADRDVVSAFQMLHREDAFWTEWEVFNWVAKGLSGVSTDFSTLMVLTLEELLTAVVLAKLVLNVQQHTAVYDQEVLSYIAVTCIEHGVWALPSPLHVAQRRVGELLALRGWPPLRVDHIRALAAGKKKLGDTEMEVQAKRYRQMENLRDLIFDEAASGIEKYKAVANVKTT